MNYLELLFVNPCMKLNNDLKKLRAILLRDFTARGKIKWLTENEKAAPAPMFGDGRAGTALYPKTRRSTIV